MTATLGHTVAKAFLPVWCHRILKDREQRTKIFLWRSVVGVCCFLYDLLF